MLRSIIAVILVLLLISPTVSNDKPEFRLEIKNGKVTVESSFGDVAAVITNFQIGMGESSDVYKIVWDKTDTTKTQLIRVAKVIPIK